MRITPSAPMMNLGSGLSSKQRRHADIFGSSLRDGDVSWALACLRWAGSQSI